MLYLALTLNVGYYGRLDLLGPASRFPAIFTLLGMATGIVIFLVSRNAKPSKTILFLALSLLVIYLLVLPSAIEPYHIADYYDAPVHMSRAVYVAVTGHSSVSADSYFDIQPGVFYATAVLMLVTRIPTDVLTKWFDLFIVAIAYVPCLLFLGKKLFRQPELALYVCLSLIVTWPGRYHYSAQVYSFPLFVIVIGLLLGQQQVRSSKTNILLAMICFPVIMLHQLVSLVILVALVATLVWLFATGQRDSRLRSLLFITLAFAMLWLAYLVWITVYAFTDFVSTLNAILDLLVKEGLLFFVGNAITRSDPMLQQLIWAKVLFSIAVFTAGSLGLVILRRRNLWPILWIMAGVVVIISLLGFPLGGRGYVERAVIFSGFLAAIGLTFAISHMPRRRLFSVVKAVLIISLTLVGSTLFNSARNYEAMTYSEHASSLFLEQFWPGNISPVLTGLKVGDISWVDQGDWMSYDALIFSPYGLVEASYAYGRQIDLPHIADQNQMLMRAYSNGFSSIYIVTHSP